MKVRRVLEYEGPEAWVKTQMARRLAQLVTDQFLIVEMECEVVESDYVGEVPAIQSTGMIMDYRTKEVGDGRE